MPTATVNGIDVYFERRGSGSRLLFLNGSGATLATTGKLVDPFAARFDVVAFDQRGLGRTSIPSGPYEMADYAADAVALMDHVGWASCRVIGTSFGGMVAQELAVSHPERVERLALLCTSPGGEYASAAFDRSTGDAPFWSVDGFGQRLDTRFTPEFLADHARDRAIVEALASAQGAPVSDDVRRGQLAQLDARSRHDVLDRLDRITCPTLVASGRYDGIAPLANSEAIAARVRSAELRVYEGGHIFFMQDSTVIPDVVDFLAFPGGDAPGEQR